MKRYQIYYDGYDKPFCQMDTVSGETFDADGQPMKRFPDFVYKQWEQGGGRIEERDHMLGYEPPAKENDDDGYSGSTPPPWLDEFEYIDWCMTH